MGVWQRHSRQAIPTCTIDSLASSAMLGYASCSCQKWQSGSSREPMGLSSYEDPQSATCDSDQTAQTSRSPRAIYSCQKLHLYYNRVGVDYRHLVITTFTNGRCHLRHSEYSASVLVAKNGPCRASSRTDFTSNGSSSRRGSLNRSARYLPHYQSSHSAEHCCARSLEQRCLNCSDGEGNRSECLPS